MGYEWGQLKWFVLETVSYGVRLSGDTRLTCQPPIVLKVRRWGGTVILWTLRTVTKYLLEDLEKKPRSLTRTIIRSQPRHLRRYDNVKLVDSGILGYRSWDPLTGCPVQLSYPPSRSR